MRLSAAGAAVGRLSRRPIGLARAPPVAAGVALGLLGGFLLDATGAPRRAFGLFGGFPLPAAFDAGVAFILFGSLDGRALGHPPFIFGARRIGPLDLGLIAGGGFAAAGDVGLVAPARLFEIAQALLVAGAIGGAAGFGGAALRLQLCPAGIELGLERALPRHSGQGWPGWATAIADQAGREKPR